MTSVEVDGHVVPLSSLDRVLWPRVGFTKGHLVEWYRRIAPVLLPHVRGRPSTLHRFPEGVDGPHFFQTRCPPHPAWLRTERMAGFRKVVDAAVLDDEASLVWAANLSTIELHPYLGCAGDLSHPTDLVVDLDPGPPAGLLDAARVALDVRRRLEAHSLTSFVTSSGGLGMHVTVPLAHGSATYDETKAFTRALAAELAAAEPERVTDRMGPAHRAGKVFVDWFANDSSRSLVAPYSLRASAAVPVVAAPFGWDEVQAAVAADQPRRLVVTHLELLDRLGDLTAVMRTAPQRLR